MLPPYIMIYIHKCIHTYILLPPYIIIYIYICIHTYVHTYIRMIHTYIYIHQCSHPILYHIYIHTYAHTYIRMIHTQGRFFLTFVLGFFLIFHKFYTLQNLGRYKGNTPLSREVKKKCGVFT